MDVSKVRGGQLVAGIGGLILLIALFFLNWYNVEGVEEAQEALDELGSNLGVDVDTDANAGSFGAWDGQGFTGTIANLVILAGGAIGLAAAGIAAMDRRDMMGQVSAGAAGLGAAATLMVVLRILFQPGPNEAIGLEWGIFVALLAALAVTAGGAMMMRDTGTTFDSARDQFSGGQPPGGPPPGGQPPAAPPPGGTPPSDPGGGPPTG
jgi:hypothetical protein